MPPHSESRVERRHQRHGTLRAERKLGRDHERHAALMERMGEARSRAHHRSDVAAVAARHGDHGRPVDAAVADGGQRTTESLSGDDVRGLVRTAQYEPVRVVRRFVEVAVGEDVDVRVPRFATLAKDVGQRGIDQDGQQLAELLASAVGRARRVVASGILEGLNRADQRSHDVP